MKKRQSLWATDHRAVVLESVATYPQPPTSAQICEDSIKITTELTKKNASTMLSTLCREGLIGMNQDSTYFLTKTGLDWLINGRFDRSLPTYAERPGSRKKQVCK